MKAHEAVQLIEASTFFDAKWYVERYPDVKAANMNPAAHYCKYGWQMLRDPSNQFSTIGYLAKHQDVKKKGLNPLFHYLRYGKKEGRAIVSSDDKEILNKLKEVKSSTAPAKDNATPNKNSEKVTKQLAETQALLEHYYIRCQELEFQRLDHKQTLKMESL
ncbi:hypothetical protein SAMN04487867_11926 [Vreelandella titanicae]|uniref:hypothetical protein n=1 Tax=Vreelandella titanicae TaxID=664683 RepID=UPI00088C87A1|nr:hypothetical protein [Halomonas titanicae]SDI96828.1 hypothetical protein SAMN04487867_11926 [Halomonas titanicae]